MARSNSLALFIASRSSLLENVSLTLLSFVTAVTVGCSESGQSNPAAEGSTGIGGNGSTFGGAPATGSSNATGGTSTTAPQSNAGAASGGVNATGGIGSTGGASLGIATGGTSSGGVTSGKTASGGFSPGGTATGGALTGGSKSSGEASGGSSATGCGIVTAGTSAGTMATGGTAAGGTATGGSKPNGGAGTAGASRGGAGTGGASTGGASAGGSTSNGLCPAGIAQTIMVAKDGTGQFTTVQAAVDSIASGSSSHIRINIKAGTYTEKLTIAGRTNLCLVGDSATTTILTYNDSNSGVGSTSGSASVHISANDFSATQLTFQNTFGAGSQAVALRTTGQRQQFLNCRFVGYQDTLYVHSGSQYFRNCYVQGNTDYVFGGATAVLQNCEARNVQNGSAVTAPNTTIGTPYGIVFLGGQFTAVSGVSGVALGRPWGADGAAAFLNATLGGHISSAGFTTMSNNDPANARFNEYQSTGAGANTSGRAAYQMTSAEAAKYTIANIYGGAWTPSYSQ